MPTAQLSHTLVTDFDILINGSPLSSEEETHIIDIMVDLDIAIPSMFSITLAGSSSRRDDLAWLDNEKLFSVGNTVEIRLGYYGDRLTSIFEGDLTGIEPEFAADRAPHLTLRGYDRRHRLQRGNQTRSFIKLKDSAIASTIASEVGLKANVKDSKIIHQYLLQSNQTNLAFLQERASLIGYEVLVEGKDFFFQPMGNGSGTSLTLDFAQDELLTFYPRLSSMNQVTDFAVQGWNVKEKKAITIKVGNVTSKMGGLVSGVDLTKKAFGGAIASTVDIPIFDQGEAKQIAEAQLNRTALALITGEGSCLGRTDLKPGQVIQMQGLGKRFSGQYYVTGVKHRLRPDQGYITTFKVQRSGV
jgi:phage protein D